MHHLSLLRQFIITHYNEEELRTLCFEIEVDYDDIAGNTLGGKARELVLRLHRRRELNQLLAQLQEDNPEPFRSSGLSSSMSGLLLSIYEKSPENIQKHIRVQAFRSLIEDRTREFVGRKFIFEGIDNAIADPAFPSGYILIRGVPGIGKTSIAAQLIKQRGCVHHFNIAAQNIRSAADFLANTCAQIIAHYELPYPQLPPEATRDSSFFLSCLHEAAANTDNHPIVLVIDALDEADRSMLQASVNTLYLPPSLPEGVFVVMTSRHLADTHLQVLRLRVIDLEADSEGNLRDIAAFTRNYIQRPTMQGRLQAWHISDGQFVAAVQKKSQGNFMYVHYVLPAIEHGEFVAGSAEELPVGLKAYYHRHWRQMRAANKEEFDALYKPVVYFLAIALEPIPVSKLVQWSELSRSQVKRSLQIWREFLEFDKETQGYRLYHLSFQDFLKNLVE